jgi:hypothetical protein
MRFRLALLSLLGLALAAPAARGGELDRSFEAAAGGRLVIALAFGSVAVRTHHEQSVRIAAVSRGVGASSVRFDAYAEGADVFFRGTAEPWIAWLHSAPGVRVEAWVPVGYRVELAEPGEVEVEAVALLPTSDDGTR